MTDGTFDDIADVRALDTRVDTRPAGGTQTAVSGRPSSTAVMSLIATESAMPGYVQALACGTTPGGSSNVNVDHADQTVANLAFVAFEADGSFCLYTSGGTHLVADVQGYLAPGAFDDVADLRLIDTRVSA